MLERLQKIFSEYVKVEKLTPEMVLSSDLKVTSFDMISILMDIEEEFGLTIHDRDSSKFFTVGDIISYLEKKAK